jgi:tetratricopeptide (TPR) repeat protein
MQRALLNIIFMLCATSAISKSPKIDSLKKVLLNTPPLNQVTILNEIAWEYKNIQSDSVEFYATNALQLAERYDDLTGIAKAYQRLAIANRFRGMHLIALEQGKLSLVYAVMAHNEKCISSAYNLLASIYLEQENYKMALYYFGLSAKSSQKIADRQGVATSLMNMGSVYFEMQQYGKSMKMYYRVLDIFNSLNDQHSIALTLNNIANVHMVQKKLDSALAIYDQILPILTKYENDRDEATILLNMGVLYKEKKDFKQGLDYLFKALKQFEGINAVSYITTTLNNIADCYIELDMMHTAERYIAESQVLAEAYKLTTPLLNCYELLNKMHTRNGNFKLALQYHTAYKSLSDSIANAQFGSRLQQAETEIEALLSSNDSITVLYERKIQDILKREREKNMVQYITILGMVLVVFLLIFYVVYFMVRKSNGADN